jgi:Tol biopolymer transport system component/DNA-binding winged helix-turn-helix (wHTH) protein
LSRYRSGPFIIDLDNREVVREGTPVPLPPKVFDTLAVLVANAGRVVPKDELMREVWRDTFVEEANLTQNVFTLRRALADGGGATYIETVPRRGYRFAAPLESADAVVIEQRETERIVTEEVTVEPASRQWWGVMIAAVVVVTAVVAVLATSRAFSARGDRLDRMQLRLLTSTGTAASAAIAPDGRFVAYVTAEEGGHAIHLRQVATTSSVTIVPRTETPLQSLTFSPDGERVYYLGGPRGETTLYEVSTLGGNPRKVLEAVHSPIAFAPDGKRFAFIRWNPDRGEQALMIANVDGGAPRQLIVRRRPEVIVYGGPSWSPDGERIATVVNESFNGGAARLIEVAVRDGSERVIAKDLGSKAAKVVWLPGGDAMVVESDQLWLVSYPSGERRRITNDAADYRATGISADGTRLVAVQTMQTADVFVDGTRIHSGTGRNSSTAWLPDGRLVVLDTIDGNTDVWSMNADGSDARQLTTHPATDNHASVCGETIVFASARAGGSTIWRMDRDGGNARQLSGAGAHYGVQCAPDGSWLAYHRAGDDASWSVWRMALGGGAPLRVTQRPSTFPAISPDGQWIACNYLPEGATPDGWQLAILRADGTGAPRLLGAPAPPTRRLTWSPDGRAIVFAQSHHGVDQLMRVSVDGGAPETLMQFDAAKILSFRWSPDGSRFAIVRSRELSNVVTIEGFR